MAISMRTVRSQAIQTLLMAVLSSPVPLAATPLREKPDPHEYAAKYAGGTEPFQGDARLRVAVDREKIVLRFRGKLQDAAVIIPPAAVTEVFYAPDSQPMPEKVLGSNPYSDCDGADPGVAVCAAGVLLMEMVLSPFQSTQHFVTVRWQDNDGQGHGVTLLVSKRHYEALLADLRKATGKAWKEQQQEAIEASYSPPVTAALDVIPLADLTRRETEMLGGGAPRSSGQSTGAEPRQRLQYESIRQAGMA